MKVTNPPSTPSHKTLNSSALITPKIIKSPVKKSNDGNIYDVEAVVGVVAGKKGFLWKVKWLGYPESGCTLEPIENFSKESYRCINEFKDKNRSVYEAQKNILLKNGIDLSRECKLLASSI